MWVATLSQSETRMEDDLVVDRRRRENATSQ